MFSWSSVAERFGGNGETGVHRERVGMSGCRRDGRDGRKRVSDRNTSQDPPIRRSPHPDLNEGRTASGESLSSSSRGNCGRETEILAQRQLQKTHQTQHRAASLGRRRGCDGAFPQRCRGEPGPGCVVLAVPLGARPRGSLPGHTPPGARVGRVSE